MKWNRDSFKLIILHLSLIFVVLNGILFVFFQVLLPMMTHHGQFVTVPNLKGISIEEADSYLTQRNLRFEVTEGNTYVPDYPPMTILQQHPQGGTYVKEGRKIYLTINTATPPQIKMPNLIDGSIRNAYVRLKSHGLWLGSITYVPDVAKNAVLEQWHKGEKIVAGMSISKGSKIDLVVGAGPDGTMTKVPQVVGMSLDDAKMQLLSLGIQVGRVMYEAVTQQVPGTVARQHPDAGQEISINQRVDLWLVEQRLEVNMNIPNDPMLPEN